MPGASTVFLSHTSELSKFPSPQRSFVSAAKDAVANAGCAVSNMDYFTARDDMPASYSEDKVRRCDEGYAEVSCRHPSTRIGTSQGIVSDLDGGFCISLKECLRHVEGRVALEDTRLGESMPTTGRRAVR